MKYSLENRTKWIQKNAAFLAGHPTVSSHVCEFMSCEEDGGDLFEHGHAGADHLAPYLGRVETKAVGSGEPRKKDGKPRYMVKSLLSKEGKCDRVRVILKDTGRSALIPHDVIFKREGNGDLVYFGGTADNVEISETHRNYAELFLPYEEH
mgnify:FL=1